MTPLELFGKRLKAARKAKRLSQQELWNKTGISVGHISDLERGVKHPSFDAITSLAQALDVSPSVFFAFDLEETDSSVVLKRIQGMLQKCSHQQLLQAYKHVKAVLEP